MEAQKIVLNEERNVTLTCYIQAAGGEFGKVERRPAILILPGGGYAACSDREADPVAAPFLRAGYQAFILRYSVDKHRKWPNPLDDYEQAMGMIRERAEQWHVLQDKIAVIGFSAGGHLAGCAATISKNRPNAAILGYAVLTKEISDACNPGMAYPVECVDKNTCPCFLFTTRDDNVVPVDNTILFEKALSEYGISFESHIYAFGPHGFSTGEAYINKTLTCIRAPRWVDDSISWLADVLGAFTAEGMTEPECPPKVNGNFDDYLSADCTFGYLQGQDAAKALLSNAAGGIKAFAANLGMSEEGLMQFIRHMKLRDVMKMGNLPEDAIGQMDAALRQIVNKY